MKQRKTLEELAKERAPLQEPPEIGGESKAPTFGEIQRQREDAERRKADILEWLKAGEPPQVVLYYAIEALEGFTHDPEWGAECKAVMDKVWADLDQQSIFLDTEAESVKRMEKMRADTNRKTRKRLETSLKEYKKVAAALEEALERVEELEMIL